MKLETNKNHKRMNLSKIKEKNKIKAALLSSVLSIALFSGYTSDKNIINTNDSSNIMPQEESIDDKSINGKTKIITQSDIVDIPLSIKKQIININEDITLSYLESLKELDLTLSNNETKEDLEWLNYCTNLNTLKLTIQNDDVLDYVFQLPNLERLAINNIGSYSNTITNNSKILFSPKLYYLILTDFNVEKGLIESLNNLKILDISCNENTVLINLDIDYNKLTYLDALIVDSPYSLAIHLDTNEIYTLLKANVKIIDRKTNDMSDTLLNINKKIDKMVSIIGNDYTEDIDKLDAILMYVINNLEYDNDISEQLKNQDESVNGNRFYKKGCLYGALELDTAICGNYAALVSALCDRLKLNEIMQISTIHAWNMVYVNGNNYYLDSTLIDSALENDNSLADAKESKWYLRDPNEVDDFSHTSRNLSDIIKIEQIACNDEYDISNNLYKVTIKNSYVVNGTILTGLLLGLGLAYEERKNLIKKEIQNENSKSL